MFWLQACGSEDLIVTETHPIPTLGEAPEANALPGSYIVALKPAAYQQNKSLYFTSFASEFKHYSQQFADLLGSYGIKHTQHIGAVDLKGLAALDYKPKVSQPDSMQLQLSHKYGSTPETGVMMRIDFESDEQAQKLIEKWKLTDQIWYAEPNEISQLSGIFGDYAAQYNSVVTGDRRQIQDSIRLREAFTAIDQITPNPGRPIIAILDSGVDREHPAFKAESSAESRIWENTPANIGQAGCQDDQYGCNTTTSFKDSLGDGKVFPTGLSSFNTTCPTTSSGASQAEESNCEHGTHVAGIAVGDVNAGAIGICPVCIVLPIRIVGKIPGTDKIGILDSSILAGLKYISRFKTSTGAAGIKVVNASFGKFSRSKSVAVFIDLIHDELGAIIIAAAGNEDTNRMSYPASLTKVIAVSAIDETTYRKTAFSNFGSWVDVAAPGEGVQSSVPGNSTEAKPGTSMAAPFVAGLAGLMVSQDPNMTPVEIRKWILDAADPKIYEGDGFNRRYNPKIVGNPNRIPLLGRGVINTEASVKEEPSATQVTTYEDFDRVEDFCGTIHYQSGQGHAIWIILLMPILFVVFNIRLSR